MKRSYPMAHQGAGGPLTNHVYDIEKELELLNHKKLLLEQQKQQMLSSKRYDQQPHRYHCQPEFAQPQNFHDDEFHVDGSQEGSNSQFVQNFQSVGLTQEFTPSIPYIPINNVQIPPTITQNKVLPSNAPSNIKKRPVGRFFSMNRTFVNTAPVSEEPEEDSVLRADRHPNAKVVGRMELALGILWKGIEEKFKKYKFFTNLKLKRKMKNQLRYRLQEVLMGKVVPQVAQEIIKIYHSQYPPSTDIGLLPRKLRKKIGSAKKNKKKSLPESDPIDTHIEIESYSAKFLPEDDPVQFTKIYFNKVIERHITKFYNRLNDIARKESNKTEDDIIADLPDIFVRTKGVSVADVKVEENRDGFVSTTQQFSEQTQPRVITVQQENNETEDKQANGDAVIENAGEPRKKKKPKVPPTSINLIRQEKAIAYRKLLDNLIDKRISNLLLERQEDFLNLIDMDTMYRSSSAWIYQELNKLEESLKEDPSYLSLTSKGRTVVSGENSEVTPTIREAMFYVMVVGKPSLPDKIRMKEFIDTFNPISIKKHKLIADLLFIGFESKADMERILNANGFTIDGKKLEITFIEKHDDTQNQTNDNDNYLDFGSDLEDSITQLLAAVRNSEDGNSEIKEECSYGDSCESQEY